MGKKLKKFYKQNRIYCILMIVSLLCFLLMGSAVLIYFVNQASSDPYGKRLQNIEKYQADKEIKEMEKFYEDSKKVTKANVRLQGKIIYVTVEMEDSVKNEEIQNIATKSLDKLTEDQKNYYDIQFIFTRPKLAPYLGSKSSSKTLITWAHYTFDTEENKDKDKDKTKKIGETMKKAKKIIIIVIISVILASGLGYGLYKAIVDENALSIAEKKWLDENAKNLVSLAIPNDVPVFGNAGEGVFFDFADYLVKSLDLNLNPNMVSYLSKNAGYRFEITDQYDKDGLLLYSDHYVLVSKATGLIENSKEIIELKPGILKSDLTLLKNYYEAPDDAFSVYDNYTKITESLGNGELSYALVPLTEYKGQLITNSTNILTHISDLKKFYYLRLGDNKMINSIFTKKFNSWKEKEFEESFNKNNYNLFISMLNISEAEEDTLTNKVYKYGFTENRPYEILASGEYGGISAQYLQSFSDFANVEFTFKKYKTSSELAEAAIKGKIDLYYNYYDLITNYIDSGALHSIDYYVIADNSIDLSLTNINGLKYQTVYVMKNSYLYNMIKDLEGINIITYEKSTDLKKIAKKANIIVVDENTYNYYLNKNTNSYSVRYKSTYEENIYSFRYKNDTDTFYDLFNAYTKTIDPQDLLRTGITTYNKVDAKGRIIGTIAIYTLAFIGIAFVVVFVIHKNTKTVKLNTKVKKEDKLKYIDLLTSLKNRNYYNEKLNIWNKNTIYPQACIVMDINRVKELNDTYGHEEGDKQICAVANVLIKTQIDNSEIIRTDGNEFLVYMVGYSEKQIISYMNKLLKEFKKLPYKFGVAMGFSIIDDDTKLVEDAFNEASIQMRSNKTDYEEKMRKKINGVSRRTREKLINYLKKIWEIITKPEMGLLPGQLAFFMILSLVPIITLCGFGANIFNINMDTIIEFLDNFIPGGAEFLVPFIGGETIDFKLTIVFIWMFYLASNGCNSVILVSNRIYGIKKSNWFKRRIKAIFMTLSIVLLIIFILIVPVFGMKIIELFNFLDMSDTLYKIFELSKGPFTWIIMFIFLRAIYEFAPDRVRKNSHINTGALFTSVGWIIVTNIYSFLANNMSAYNMFYGALSNIAFLMLWLYFISFIFVIGLSLNYGEELDKETMEKTGAIKIVKAG